MDNQSKAKAQPKLKSRDKESTILRFLCFMYKDN